MRGRCDGSGHYDAFPDHGWLNRRTSYAHYSAFELGACNRRMLNFLSPHVQSIYAHHSPPRCLDLVNAAVVVFPTADRDSFIIYKKSSMANPFVSTKVKEIAQSLSKETGVKPEDVEKVLNRLGLNSAIENRLAKIGPEVLRVAVGDIVQ